MLPDRESRPVGNGPAEGISVGAKCNTSLADPADSPMMPEAEAARLTWRIELRLATIADNAEAVIPMIKEAKAGNAHQALGYRSWTEYVSEKFGGTLVRLRKAERVPFVELLADQGMSTRAIGEVVGVSKDTVSRDLRAGVSNETPGDGRLRPDEIDGLISSGLVKDLDELEHCMKMADSTDEEFEQSLTDARQDGDLSKENVMKKIAAKKTTGIDGKSYPKPEPKPPRRRPLPDSYRDAAYKLMKAVESVERLHMDDRFVANKETLLARNRFELLQAHKKLTAICADLGVDTGAEPPICRDCGNKLVLGPPSRLRELGIEPRGDDVVLESGGAR